MPCLVSIADRVCPFSEAFACKHACEWMPRDSVDAKGCRTENTNGQHKHSLYLLLYVTVSLASLVLASMILIKPGARSNRDCTRLDCYSESIFLKVQMAGYT